MFLDIQNSLIPFLASIGIPDKWHLDVDFWIFLFTFTFVFAYALLHYAYKLTKHITLWHNQSRLNEDLHPFYTKAEIDKATRYYIPTKYQDSSPSQADEPGHAYISSPKALLIPTMLNTIFREDNDRYYLILADSGMGKTTFMINLYLAYKKQWFWRKKYVIKLLPLAHPKTFEVIDKIKGQENTILLLDALDEDNEAVKDYKKRLDQIINKTWKFREIIVTCRTQFFPKETEEPSKVGHLRYGPDGGAHHFRKQYISVFSDDDIKSYLRKRFSFFLWGKRNKAWRIVHNSPNLMVRPMLLSRIKDLVNEDRDYQYSYQIYETLIRMWINREAGKPGVEEKYSSSQASFKSKLYAFSCDLAKNIYFERNKRDGRLSIHYTEQIVTSSGIQLSDYEDFIKEPDWRNRSLLNRDADGNYKFSHKSILEYFLAIEAVDNKKFFMRFNLDGMDAAKSFIEEMVLGEIFAKSKGVFFTRKYNKSTPLSRITKKDCPDISILKITNAREINLWCLPFLYKRFQNHTLILTDKSKLDLLRSLYIINGDIREDLSTSQLQVRQQPLEILEVEKLLDSFGLEELKDKLKRLDRTKWLERLVQLELLESQELRKLRVDNERLRRLSMQVTLSKREHSNLNKQLASYRRAAFVEDSFELSKSPIRKDTFAPEIAVRAATEGGRGAERTGWAGRNAGETRKFQAVQNIY